MTKDERVCIECGTKVGGDESRAGNMIASLMAMLFYLALVGTVASLFLSHGPSLMLCMMITSALMFIMRSAKDGATAKVKKR